jgi:hypothetical protein
LNCTGITSTTTTTTTSSTTVGPTGITVHAHRIPASYWDPCFATQCTNPYASCNTSCTGPGATMYFALYDANGHFIAGRFADENGYTFTGLTPGATYYIYPDDCTFATALCTTSCSNTGGTERQLDTPLLRSGRA